MNVLLEFKAVSLKYRQKQVIDNLTFTLRKGEVLALLGPSGCGKTSILNITSGLVKVSDGQVVVHTKEFGYVFQEPRLLPWRSVIDNVCFVMKEQEKKVRREKASLILKRVGLLDVANEYPAPLSGGMKQRVSIARALASDPQIILMDEPFSALDYELKNELQEDVIQLIEEQNTGIIYVTHDPIEAIKLADRILVFTCNGCSIKYEMKIEKNRQERNYDFVKQVEQELREWVGGINYATTI